MLAGVKSLLRSSASTSLLQLLPPAPLASEGGS